MIEAMESHSMYAELQTPLVPQVVIVLHVHMVQLPPPHGSTVDTQVSRTLSAVVSPAAAAAS